MCDCTLLASNEFTPIYIEKDTFTLRLIQANRTDVLCEGFTLEGVIAKASVTKIPTGYQILLER